MKGQRTQRGWRPVGGGVGVGVEVGGLLVGNFASHLLTVKHVITMCCPLVYLPSEDIGPLLVTIRAKQPIICVPSIRCDLYRWVVPTLLRLLCL